MLTNPVMDYALHAADATGVADGAIDALLDDAERERNYLAGVDGGDENPAQYSNDNG